MTNFNFSPFPILKTERLHLRPLIASDAHEVLFMRSDTKVNEYIIRKPMENLKEAKAFIQKIDTSIRNKKCIDWVITNKENSQFIGTICLWNLEETKKYGEIGYALHPEEQGKGIMNEAMQCVLNYGFESMGLKTIEAYTHRENEASKKLLERNGFVLDPARKDEGFPHNVIFTLQVG